MAGKTSLVTRKGQVTIPIALRRELGIREGDRVEFVRQEDGIRVIPVVSEEDRFAELDRYVDSLPEESVVRRTALVGRRYRRPGPAPTIEELKRSVGWAIAEEWERENE